MSVKDIILFIVSVLFLGCIVFAIVWTSTNWSKLQDVFSGANIYTQQDLDNKYNEGYNQSKDDLDNLNNQIKDLQKENSSLSSDLDNANNEILLKDSQIDNLQNENSNLKNQNETLKTDNATLIEQNQTLQENIDYYLSYIDSIRQENEFIVTFLVKDKVYYSDLVTQNDYSVYSGGTINTVYYNFVGWSIDKTNIIDLSTYPITEDTTFYAVLETIAYDVVFYDLENNIVESKVVNKNSLVTDIPTLENTTYTTFRGWSIDRENMVDFNTYSVTANVTFYPIFETTAFDVVFKNYDDSVVYSTVVEKGGKIYGGSYGATKGIDYVFDGWSLDGVTKVATPYTITENTIFIAVYRELVNPYVRIIVDGQLDYYLEASEVNDDLSDLGYSYTTSKVKPVIYLGDLNIVFNTSFICYDIYVTTDGTNITVSYDNKNVSGTFGANDELTYMIELRPNGQSYNLDNIYYGNF